MKKFLFNLLAVISVFVISACEKNVIAEAVDYKENDSKLTVLTRTSGDDNASGEISYPVNIYIFDNEGKCVALDKIDSENTEMSINIGSGNYDVYAIARADAGKYDLPSKESATKETVISLKEGQEHGCLMAANASTTVKPGENNTVTLALKRKVMLIGSITINNIPDDVTDVIVTISPLYENLLLNGDYSGENGSKAINLVEESDGITWKADCNLYLLEAVDDAAIKVSLVRGEEVESFTSNSINALKANSRINIVGSYDKSTLKATITGEDWEDFQDVILTFDDEGGVVPPVTPPSPIPTVGSIYEDAALVLSAVPGGNETVVTLMSIAESSGLVFEDNQESVNSVVKDAVNGLAVSGISGWRLATTEEMKYVIDNKEMINSWLVDNGKPEFKIEVGTGGSVYSYYFENEAGNVKIMNSWTGSISENLPKSDRTTSILRAFTTITFVDE